MKVYTNIGVIVGMLLFSRIAQGQSSYKRYTQPKSPFQLDTVFNPAYKGFISSGPTNHLWLTTLSYQYIDTTKNKINAAVVPVYTPIKKNALTNPSSPLNQFIAAMLPYGYYFPPTLYGLDTYGSYSRTDPTFPHGYSPYNLRAPGSPYFMSTKF